MSKAEKQLDKFLRKNESPSQLTRPRRAGKSGAQTDKAGTRRTENGGRKNMWPTGPIA